MGFVQGHIKNMSAVRFQPRHYIQGSSTWPHHKNEVQEGQEFSNLSEDFAYLKPKLPPFLNKI